MEKPLHYLENQFDTATQHNWKKGIELDMYHMAALGQLKLTYPILVDIYDRTLPLNTVYVGEYNKWVSAGGAQEGQTLNLKQLLKLTRPRLDEWIPQILVVYGKTTPRYKAIFPNGRKPFNTGSIDSRVNAFSSLSLNIGADPALAAVKILVDATYATLNAARASQGAAKTTLKGGSGSVEAARLASMDMQYRNLAFVMDNFFENRITITNQLFDLETLRDHQQLIFTGTLTPNENEAVLIHTFMPDDKLRLKSNGPASIKFYLASTPGGTDSNGIVVDANHEIEVLMSEFTPADFATHRYLTAVNQSTGETTQYIVEIL